MIDEMRVSHGVPLRVAIASDVGRVRDSNEDSFGHTWLADGTLFVMVADGMGGHAAGEVASGIAVQVLEEVVARDPDADPRERLFKGLLEAHDAILQEGRASGMRGMGTTAIVSLCLGAEIYVALVGDSRLYHVRKGHPMWRTSDHTRVQMLVEQGLLQQSEVTGHVEYGKLTRALGHPKMADGRPLTPDVLASPIRLLRDDALVLCSDGLHDLVQDGEIGQAIAGREPADAARELVRLANERGGHDNVTVAVIVAGERTSDYDASYVPEAPTWARTPVAAPEVAPPPVARPEATWSEPPPPPSAPVAEAPAPDPEVPPPLAEAAPPAEPAATEPGSLGNAVDLTGVPDPARVVPADLPHLVEQERGEGAESDPPPSAPPDDRSVLALGPVEGTERDRSAPADSDPPPIGRPEVALEGPPPLPFAPTTELRPTDEPPPLPGGSPPALPTDAHPVARAADATEILPIPRPVGDPITQGLTTLTAPAPMYGGLVPPAPPDDSVESAPRPIAPASRPGALVLLGLVLALAIVATGLAALFAAIAGGTLFWGAP